MIARFSVREWAAANWFMLALPVLLAISFGLTRWEPWQEAGPASEAVLLFDWCLTVPALYALCYRTKLPLRQLLLRLIALACLGVWIVSWLVPAEAQVVVSHFSWARALGSLSSY